MQTDPDAIVEWRGIVDLVRASVRGLTPEQLDRREGEEMTPREVVHHVVEANVVAAGIVVAALGSPGCVFDWSWMLPFGPWMERVRHDQKALEPSLRLLEARNDWIVAQLEPLPDGLEREVLLVDEPGAPPRRTTVAGVLLQEAAHARDHLRLSG